MLRKYLRTSLSLMLVALLAFGPAMTVFGETERVGPITLWSNDPTISQLQTWLDNNGYDPLPLLQKAKYDYGHPGNLDNGTFIAKDFPAVNGADNPFEADVVFSDQKGNDDEYLSVSFSNANRLVYFFVVKFGPIAHTYYYPEGTLADGPITVSGQQAISHITFYYGDPGIQYAAVSGYKWHDLNADGIWDEGEPGLNGWTINLWTVVDDELAIVATTTTANDGDDNPGYYEFTTLMPGVDYYVSEEFPEDETWFMSFPNGEIVGALLVEDVGYVWGPISLEPDGIALGKDFGNYQYAEKSGYKWHDLNADGIWDDGEPVLANWTINLWAGNPLAIIDTTTTDANGYYEFTELMPGVDYYVSEEFPENETWFMSYPNVKTTGAVMVQGVGYVWGPINLSSGEAEEDNNFGNYQYAAISGYKWHDLSNDGIWDMDEPVLANWTINLWTDLGEGLEIVATTTTDIDGYYEFTELMPGADYFVSEAIPAGWEQTFPNDTTFIEGIGYIWGPINLMSQETEEDLNFGNYKLPDPPTSQTAWAYDPARATPNWDLVNNKFWGWTNGGYAAGTYELEIWAGAGQNDLSKGTHVGTLYVAYLGGTATVKYEAKPGFSFTEFHLWVGNTPLPQITQGKKTAYTNAPGQFPHIVSFDEEDAVTEYTFTVDGLEGNIHVAAHAVVWGYFDSEEEMVVTTEATDMEEQGGGRPATVDIGDAANFGQYISEMAKEGPKGASSAAPGRNK